MQLVTCLNRHTAGLTKGNARNRFAREPEYREYMCFLKKKVLLFRSLLSFPLILSSSRVENSRCCFKSRLHGSVGRAQSSGDSWPTRQEVVSPWSSLPSPPPEWLRCVRPCVRIETRWFRDEKFSPRFRICLSGLIEDGAGEWVRKGPCHYFPQPPYVSTVPLGWPQWRGVARETVKKRKEEFFEGLRVQPVVSVLTKQRNYLGGVKSGCGAVRWRSRNCGSLLYIDGKTDRIYSLHAKNYLGQKLS